MKRLTIWLAISLATFAFGVTAAMLYLTWKTPTDITSPDILPLIENREGLIAPAQPKCFPGLSVKAENVSASLYFPNGAFYAQPEREKFRVEWYSKHLRAMGERPLLSESDSQTESYRFLWLRSFHHPIAVRVWRAGGGQFINVKELSGAGGYEPGKLMMDETRPLTKSHWSEFIYLLAQSCFWNLPAENDEMGNDGAQWILEGQREGRYKVVDRWSPESGTFRDVCLYLLKESKLKIDSSDEPIY